MHRFALVLFLAACTTTSTPTTYADGPMMPAPRAPAFDPTFDSPNPFERPERPALQPNPKPTRVLPETPETRREPGLWNSTAPKASLPVGPPQILGVTLPFAPGHDTEGQRYYTHYCAGLMGRAAKKVVGNAKLSREMTRCLAATQYATCMAGLAKLDLKLQNVGTGTTPAITALVESTLRTALAFERDECPADIGSAPERRDLADKITAEFDKSLRSIIQ